MLSHIYQVEPDERHEELGCGGCLMNVGLSGGPKQDSSSTLHFLLMMTRSERIKNITVLISLIDVVFPYLKLLTANTRKLFWSQT